MEEIIFFSEEAKFYCWLEEHHNKTQELWVGFYRKDTGKNSITWSESVDVALCFGWVDGIRKSIDDVSYRIRFTPRKLKSVWSAVNVKKVEKLIQEGRMKPEGLHLFNLRSDTKGYSAADRNVELRADYELLIKANAKAWTFLENLAPSYRRDSIWWVMSAKREDTCMRRLGVLIESCEQGLKIPMLRKK